MMSDMLTSSQKGRRLIQMPLFKQYLHHAPTEKREPIFETSGLIITRCYSHSKTETSTCSKRAVVYQKRKEVLVIEPVKELSNSPSHPAANHHYLTNSQSKSENSNDYYGSNKTRMRIEQQQQPHSQMEYSSASSSHNHSIRWETNYRTAKTDNRETPSNDVLNEVFPSREHSITRNRRLLIARGYLRRYFIERSNRNQSNTEQAKNAQSPRPSLKPRKSSRRTRDSNSKAAHYIDSRRLSKTNILQFDPELLVTQYAPVRKHHARNLSFRLQKSSDKRKGKNASYTGAIGSGSKEIMLMNIKAPIMPADEYSHKELRKMMEDISKKKVFSDEISNQKMNPSVKKPRKVFMNAKLFALNKTFF